MTIHANDAFGDGLPSTARLVNLAGSFWYRFFSGRDELEALLEPVRQADRQMFRDLTEMASRADYRQFPAFHTETFAPLFIRLQDITKSPLRYGDDAAYGPDSGDEFYGQTNLLRWSFPVPENLVSAAALMDFPLTGSFHFTEGMQFWIKNGSIDMAADPVSVFPRKEIDGIDYYVAWLYMAQFDVEAVSRYMGVLFDLLPRSTTNTRNAFGEALYAQIDGSSELAVRKVIASAVGLELPGDGETVVEVFDELYPVVITDKATYHGPRGSSASVQVGDTVLAGDMLFDVAKFADFRSVPTWLNELRLPPALSRGETLAIPRGDIDVTSVNIDGKLIIKPTNEDHPFFDWLNSLSPSLSWMVADYYSLPVDKSANYSSALVPDSIDFLAILSKYLFGSKLSVSLLSSDALLPESATILGLLRHVLSPWTTHIVHFDGDAPTGWPTDATNCC